MEFVKAYLLIVVIIIVALVWTWLFGREGWIFLFGVFAGIILSLVFPK